MSTFQNTDNGYYGSSRLGGETHDPGSCIVQSASKSTAHVSTCGIPPSTHKFRSHVDRSFGYRSVAFHNSGGSTRMAWTSDTADHVPIRLFGSADFEHAIRGGWVFLTDGTIYACWAPTRGDTLEDPESTKLTSEKAGRWFVSSYVPGPDGESCVVEVGDQASFGSYEAFVSEILTRNSRPRWQDNKVTYRTRDGKVLEWGMMGNKGYLTIDGVAPDMSSYPLAEMPGLSGNTITSGGGSVTFDFERGEVRGSPVDRVAGKAWFTSPD